VARQGCFQDRREYIPVGFDRNILLLTILKTPLPSHVSSMRRRRFEAGNKKT
jgi:hypothetical protein